MPQKNRRTKAAPGKESVEERVKRHLNDINSVITEDDIKNVTTVLTEPNKPSNNQDPVKESKGRKSRKQKKEKKTDSGEKQTTPWDLLSEGYD